MSSEIEEIKNRLNVVELVGEYIRVSKAGSNWKALCPFHNEKTPSFMLSEERKSWHCFGCGKGGDIFSFVMEMEGVGFREALETLAQKAGIELKRNEKWERGDEKKENKKILYEIMELAARRYEDNLWSGKESGKILKYLKERGLTKSTLEKFRIGYALEGWGNILEYLRKKNYKVEEIAKTGLLVEKNLESKTQDTRYKIQDTNYYDRFRDRIMFPIQDTMGKVVGFSARIAPGGDEKSAKYINTPQTALYDKSRTLYGLNFAKTEIKRAGNTVLVEGNMDVIAAHQAGFRNTIAVSGTALTPEQIQIVKRYSENLKIAFDMDEAGQAAAKKSARICLSNDLNVKIVVLPSGKDAADAIKENKDIWKQALLDAREVMDYYFEDAFRRYNVKEPTDKKKIARELLNIVKDIADSVEKSHWIKVLAEKLDVSEETLLEVLGKIKSEKRRVEEKNEKEQLMPVKGNFSPRIKRIIGIVLAFPRESKKIIGNFKIDPRAEETETRIISTILSDQHNLDIESIKRKTKDYNSQKYIDEAVFEIEIESRTKDGFDPAAELKEIVDSHNRIKIKDQLVLLCRDIKEAEKSGDKNALKIMLEKFQEYSRELGNNK